MQGTACGPNQDDGKCIFAQQPNDAFGSVRPGSLRGPGFQNIDMAVFKNFPVWHEHHAEFSANLFNAFNIADYAAPDSGMTDGNFGQITGISTTFLPRDFQFAGHINF